MTATTRRNLAVGILLWALLWPWAHRAAVAQLGINPWKLGGFAMYAAPSPPLRVALVSARSGEVLPIDPSTLTPGAQRALVEFHLRRHALGRLHSPDVLAERVLEARHDLPGVIILIETPRLDRKTARLEKQLERYVYGPWGDPAP